MAFRFRCACLFLCAHANAAVAQTPLLRGRWVPEQIPLLLSLDFRAEDTVWQLVPVAAISANGRGTYDYVGGRLILHYGEGSTDTAAVTVNDSTLVSALGHEKQTWTRIAPARGARSPLHGTWVAPCLHDDCQVITYLPGGGFFQEAVLVGHYSVDAATITITTVNRARPMKFHVQISGADTVLTPLDSVGQRFRRPRCDDPRLDPLKTFVSACS